jgi:acetyltransferase-like isoleucine patch superfamily enzyme
MTYQNSNRIRSVGKYTYGQHNIEIYYWGEGTWLDIGNFCSISGHITVYLGGNHRVDWATTYPFGHIHQNIFPTFNGLGQPWSKGNVIIGNDVWIGFGSILLAPVKIGNHAIVAAGSVVRSDVPDFAIVAGNPSKIVGWRFGSKTTRKKHADKIAEFILSEQLIDLNKFTKNQKFSSRR